MDEYRVMIPGLTNEIIAHGKRVNAPDKELTHRSCPHDEINDAIMEYQFLLLSSKLLCFNRKQNLMWIVTQME